MTSSDYSYDLAETVDDNEYSRVTLFVFGSGTMKSMVIISHFRLGDGNGCKGPIGPVVLSFIVWHVHDLTESLIVCSIFGEKYSGFSLLFVFNIPKCPVDGVSW